jgi:SAM-dependent methyltransferase
MLGAARLQFLKEYGTIRAAEGRGSSEPVYYRDLPFRDHTGRNQAQWNHRARTFRYFVRHILPHRPSRILDLGAGNCWLSYRLAELGHEPVAIDIFSDSADGLGAAQHYPFPVPAVEAEFDHLPVRLGHFDLVIYNASIHYSADYARTLREAARCLRPGGRLVILDSPVYARKEHGDLMRSERQKLFERLYGFRSEALGSIEYFDLQMLETLARELNLKWTVHKPWYGLSWHLRPLRARLKRQRPSSRFWILVGEFQ